MGIEPTALAWEARVLPLYDARSGQSGCHSKRRSGALQIVSAFCQPSILASVEKKGRQTGVFGVAFDATEEDDVVTALVGCFVGDLKNCTAIGQNRRTANTRVPVQTSKAVRRPSGEAVGKVFLISGQDVDDVVAGAAEGAEVDRAVVEAPEHQRGIERYRRKRVNGQAYGPAIGVDRRHDGNAGGEAPEGVAQGTVVDLCLGHRGGLAGEKAVLSVLPSTTSRQKLPVSASFAERLVTWQKVAGRHDLPWQKTRNPYRIWLSEIMLQQTQVSTVIPYYQRFLASFPDVLTLAAAPIEVVIAHWAGLGYYARARNLHRCAQAIATVYGGKFPNSSNALAELPGIGRSTAAAIAAFAFGKRVAILDGNVKRVLCRYFGIEGFPALAAVDRKLWVLAETLLPEHEIEAYTQGIMDLGASICTRSRPRCDDCPMAGSCIARETSRQSSLPTAKPRKALPERSSTFVLITEGTRLLLERRPGSGLWGGLLVPPEGEPTAILARLGLRLKTQSNLASLTHRFSHFQLTLQPVWCAVENALTAAEPGHEWIDLAHAGAAGVPTPIKKLIRQVASVAG